MLREGRQLMLGLFGIQTLLVVCFFVLVRYRMLIEPLIFIFAAVGFSRLWAAVCPGESANRGRIDCEGRNG